MADIQSYVGNEQAFPVLANWDFFNHGGVAPLPRAVADALRKFADEAQRGAYLETSWYKDIEKLRVASAAMLNAHRDEVAFIKNTSEGISIVANGIDWKPGDQIVTTAVEYPANIYPWMELERSRGCKLVMVAEGTDAEGRRAVPLDAILARAAEPATRMVTLSHVEFASGQRHDIAVVGRFCREHGKLFCVDAIQTLGVLPVDVQAMCIDYLSADGHKWLLGPEGAGIFYIRRELIEKTRPPLIGWMNVVDALNYGTYNYTLRPDAGRYECGSYNVPGLLGLKAAVEMLGDLGTPAISARVKVLTDRLIDGLKGKGYQIISPRDGDAWSGIVSFTSSKHDQSLIVASLRKEHRIELALREGRLRASPHFYNTEEQMDRLVAALP
ncbi:MAG TPA: aminotransferase class V-fold PLP-dependent enzyme [Humisphaera sp.]|jgi:selenocysteine lyase/cysteine desulfurase|nr:aminotransferase class V-fold PLP-dependent enzyme [Humisphaera sp.]